MVTNVPMDIEKLYQRANEGSMYFHRVTQEQAGLHGEFDHIDRHFGGSTIASYKIFNERRYARFPNTCGGYSLRFHPELCVLAEPDSGPNKAWA